MVGSAQPRRVSQRLTPKSKPKYDISDTDDDDSSPLSSGRSISSPSNPGKDEESELNSKPRKPEPAIYDQPLSSSDEEEGGGRDNDQAEEGFARTPVKPGLTLEEKLELARDSENKAKKESKLKSQSPSSSRKRTAKVLDDDNKDDLFGFDFRSSQRSHKRFSYTSKSKWRKTPSSSMPDSQPPSSAAQPKSTPATSPGKGETENGEKGTEKIGFQVPRDFEAELGLNYPLDFQVSQEIADSEDELDSPLSSPPSEREYLCPMCGECVEPGLLLVFEAQPRQRIRDKQKFCDSHRKSAAEDEWKTRGYPTIEWDKFDQRIESHFKDLEKFLDPEYPSYYRNLLDTLLKSGNVKNLKLSLSGDAVETISCGYYGTRGSGKMLQSIMAKFASKLRHLAIEDRIVKWASVVGYSQAVLVPELAIRLIKEDLSIDDDDSARSIMRESIMLGEKLNFALNDHIPITDEDRNRDLLN
ncbi:RTC4-like domain-containing protein [Aspergillus californicus]